MWHWYVSRPNEIFIDADHWDRCKDHVRARLQGAIECGKLDVKNVHLFPSNTSGHMHMIIELNDDIDGIESAIWAVLFHSDIYRAYATIMRYMYHPFIAPDILISPKELHRGANAICYCKEKHSYHVMEKCEAAKMLRGKFRTLGFFGKPSKNPCKFLP